MLTDNRLSLSEYRDHIQCHKECARDVDAAQVSIKLHTCSIQNWASGNLERRRCLSVSKACASQSSMHIYGLVIQGQQFGL